VAITIKQIVPFWLELIRSPGVSLKGQVGKGDRDTAGRMAIYTSLVLPLILSLMLLAASLASGDFGNLFGTLLMIAFILIAFTGGLAAGFLLINWITYQLSTKILGGKGDYGTQSYLLSLVFSLTPLLFILPILSALLFNSIAVVAILIALLVNLLYVYLWVVALRVSHGFGTLKAAIAGLVLIILLFISSMMSAPRA
jgi:hypothetical protein